MCLSLQAVECCSNARRTVVVIHPASANECDEFGCWLALSVLAYVIAGWLFCFACSVQAFHTSFFWFPSRQQGFSLSEVVALATLFVPLPVYFDYISGGSWWLPLLGGARVHACTCASGPDSAWCACWAMVGWQMACCVAISGRSEGVVYLACTVLLASYA